MYIWCVNENAHIAVMTGDVINSRASTGDWLALFKNYLQEFGPSPRVWEIYRGDSFQIRIDDASEIIEKAIWLKAAMKSNRDLGLNLRMGIGIGTVNPDAGKVTESNGEAFINSGNSFENLKKNTLAIKTPWTDVDATINVCLKLAEHTMSRWTWRQAEVVKASMETPGSKQEEIAKVLGTTQSRVSERQISAGYDAINDMMRYCQTLIRGKTDPVKK